MSGKFRTPGRSRRIGYSYRPAYIANSPADPGFRKPAPAARARGMARGRRPPAGERVIGARPIEH